MKEMNIIVILIVIGTLFYLYSCNLSGSKVDISNKSPFKEYLDYSLNLNEDYVLCENKEFKISKEQYFILKDDNRAGLVKIDLLKKGTQVKLSKAIQYNTGLSGIIGSYVVGTVYSESLKRNVDFYYSWGILKNDFSNGKNKPYWIYPKAMWQQNEDTTKYFINE